MARRGDGLLTPRRALLTGQLWDPRCVLTEPDPDVLCEYDVRIPMSEGFHVTANGFCSHRAAATGEPMPVVMCAHPYDNHLTPALGKTPFGGPPPALRCIAPWEGVTDLNRDQMCPGGVADEGFARFWWITEVEPTIGCTPEEFARLNGGLPMDFLCLHPFDDEFWRTMVPKLEGITLPMLVCASFSDQGLHTVGSFRVFREARSPHKWVYTHRTGKWAAFYSPEVHQLTKEFMDCFLRDGRVMSARVPNHVVRCRPLQRWRVPAERGIDALADEGRHLFR